MSYDRSADTRSSRDDRGGSRGDAHRRDANLDCKVYVGNLGSRPPRREDLEYEFSYYGKLRNVWVARSPPGFAYVEFEDTRDARDACRGLDGKQMDGRRLRVEMCHGRSRPKPWQRDGDRGDRRRSRSPRRRSRSRSRSRSGGHRNGRSNGDKSESPYRSKSNSRGRSRSRSRDSRSRSRD